MKKLTILLSLFIFIIGTAKAQQQLRFSATTGTYGVYLGGDESASGAYNERNAGNTNYQLGFDYIANISPERSLLMVSASYGKSKSNYSTICDGNCRDNNQYDIKEYTTERPYLSIGFFYRLKLHTINKHTLGLYTGFQYHSGLINIEETRTYKDNKLIFWREEVNINYTSTFYKLGATYEYALNENTVLFCEPNFGYGRRVLDTDDFHANITFGISLLK